MSDTKSIWKKPANIADLNKLNEHVAVGLLGIEVIDIGPDFIAARMEVVKRTQQPFGLLHGGVSCVLAETLGSLGSYLAVDEPFVAVGTDINASHLRAVRSGFVTGTARPIRMGRRMHWWEIDITDDQQRSVCIARLTVAIIEP